MTAFLAAFAAPNACSLETPATALGACAKQAWPPACAAWDTISSAASASPEELCRAEVGCFALTRRWAWRRRRPRACPPPSRASSPALGRLPPGGNVVAQHFSLLDRPGRRHAKRGPTHAERPCAAPRRRSCVQRDWPPTRAGCTAVGFHSLLERCQTAAGGCVLILRRTARSGPAHAALETAHAACRHRCAPRGLQAGHSLFISGCAALA